ncbi:MAG TPA: hypothetical protein VHC98_02890, partial [Candidatus Saccharimonadales bacterium]|nr:hypothetical protein [Candidatus Saccharimonadales bacterium]
TTGMVDFAVWLPCFNIITVTPSQPKKELNCTSLTATQTATDDKKHTITYHFVATATEKYNPITGYLFDFGDKSTKNVATSATTASTDHTYTQTNADQTITSTVKVNGTVGGPDCTKQFKIPAIPKQPASIACVSLTATPAEGSTNKYVFTAMANPVNTTVTSYTFTFGDGSSETVATNTDTHTYGDGVSDTASVVINSPIGSTAVIPACQASIKTPTPPSQLTNTGAGDVLGIFAAATAAGAIFHRFVLRRKLAV